MSSSKISKFHLILENLIKKHLEVTESSQSHTSVFFDFWDSVVQIGDESCDD